MVIGIDGSRAFIKNPTGTETYSYQLIKNLARIDHNNDYLVYLRDYPISSTIAQVIGQFPSNFQFKGISWPRLWTQAGLAIQTFKDRLDVLFIPAHTLPLIRKPDLKTVITVHDLGSEYLPKMHQLKQRIYLSIMQRYQLASASKIIAVSRATKSDLVNQADISPDKIAVVYEGYDQKAFKPVKDDLLINTLSHYNLQTKTYYLFVGTVQPRKNLARLIKAYHSLLGVLSARSPIRSPRLASLAATPRSLPLLVITGSKGWLSEEIYQLPKKLGIADRVKFLGYVPKKDLPSLYSGALALVFPSLFEGFGLPILEAQACGCPVITSNLSSMPEVAGKGAIYVNPYQIDDIVKGMVRVKRERVKLIKKGLENVKRFSWQKCARETLAVLEGLA